MKKIKRALEIDIDEENQTRDFLVLDVFEKVTEFGYIEVVLAKVDKFTMTEEEIKKEEKSEGKDIKQQIIEAYEVGDVDEEKHKVDENENLYEMSKKELATIYCDIVYKGRKEYKDFLEMTIRKNTKKELIMIVKGARVFKS